MPFIIHCQSVGPRLSNSFLRSVGVESRMRNFESFPFRLQPQLSNKGIRYSARGDPAK
jgi:hypothetical protein